MEEEISIIVSSSYDTKSEKVLLIIKRIGFIAWLFIIMYIFYYLYGPFFLISLPFFLFFDFFFPGILRYLIRKLFQGKRQKLALTRESIYIEKTKYKIDFKKEYKIAISPVAFKSYIYFKQNDISFLLKIKGKVENDILFLPNVKHILENSEKLEIPPDSKTVKADLYLNKDFFKLLFSVIDIFGSDYLSIDQ